MSCFGDSIPQNITCLDLSYVRSELGKHNDTSVVEQLYIRLSFNILSPCESVFVQWVFEERFGFFHVSIGPSGCFMVTCVEW